MNPSAINFTQPEATTPVTLGYLDKRAFAARLGLSPRTVDNMVAARELPRGVRIGRFLYWSEQAVTVWQEHAFAKQLEWVPGTTKGRRVAGGASSAA